MQIESLISNPTPERCIWEPQHKLFSRSVLFENAKERLTCLVTTPCMREFYFPVQVASILKVGNLFLPLSFVIINIPLCLFCSKK